MLRSTPPIHSPRRTLQAQTTTQKRTRRWDIHGLISSIRNVLAILGAVAIFFYIQYPDSLLNRRISEEGLIRERAKLVIEALKLTDEKSRAQAMAVIYASYPKNNTEWFSDIDKALTVLDRYVVHSKELKEHQSKPEATALSSQKLNMSVTAMKEEESKYNSLIANLIALENEIPTSIREMRVKKP